MDEHYIYARLGFELVRKFHRSDEKARSRLLAALQSGAVTAVGFPTEDNGWGIVRWRRITENVLSHIPPQFWASATEEDQATWSWTQGNFRVSDRTVAFGGDSNSYRDVRFSNAGIEILTGAEPDPRGRRRTPTWDEWVAELVLLALDGKVVGTLTETKLLRLVNERLAERGIDEMSRTTVDGVVKAVLNALRQQEI